MSSAKPKEIPKGNTKSGGGGGGSANKSGNRSKGDIKSDKVDLNPKIQATAEQMQIARIIESHRSEDPELQKKIKQVIEITGSTPDAASMALHSRDNNLEEAITLLTEGGTESLELEWEQAGKKKKIKSAAQKADAAKEMARAKENGPGGRDRNDKRGDTRPDRGDRDRTASTSEAQQGEGFFEGRRGGRGRGRGDSRGGRGGGMGRGGPRVENKENDESNDVGGSGGYGSRFSNGPMRGRGRGGGRGGFRGGDRDRDPSRTFANRSRGPRESDFGHHPIDVWENSQADTTKADAKPTNLKVDQWTDFPQTEDWDNEEYTGSLAETKVFVPTALQAGTEGAPVSQTTPPNGETILATDTTSNGIGGPTNHLGPAAGHVVAGQSIDLNILLSKQSPPVSAANPGANLLASIQSSYSSAAAQQISQTLMPRPKVSPSQPGGVGTTNVPRQAQRTVPSTKIPTTGVEMPDDSVAKLDVQFGGLDFGTTGSTFNSVVQQHNSSKLGGSGDMMYSGVGQQSMDNYGQQVSNVEKEMGQNKSVSNQQQGDPGAAFQNQQQRGSSQMQQQQQSNSGPLMSDSMSKSVPISPANLENQQLSGLSSVQSQNQGSKIPATQSHQQASSYTNAAAVGISHGSAFVTYNTKPAPGFPAPGFPPVMSQTQQTGPGAYNAIPTGQIGYGSQPSMIMTHTQQPSSGYGMGMSTYGSLPIVSASVQPSHMPGQTIPNQNLTQLSNTTSTYGVPAGIPYQSASTITIPNSVAYNVSAASYNPNPYQKMNQMGSSSGQLQQGGKETVNDIGSSNTSAPTTSTAQLGSSGLQGNAASSGASGKISSNVSTAGSTNSKQQTTTTGGVGAGATAGSMPPGMVYPPQGYIVNQGAIQGVPMYGFQGPMYSYDENQVQFLPRLPHPALAASYFDANASSFTPGGSGRTDGSSLQSYPGSDARFSRSDSSAASPVPSNLPGQATTPMYNIPQGGGYYYVGNNPMVHPGAFAQYAPPQMYPTTGLVTPNNPTGAPHTVSNHQYQNKGVSYGNSYINPYDTSAQQTGITGVTDYVNKNTYSSSTGTGSGGPNSTGGTGAKGSVSTAGSSQQSTDMSSSIYGNKPHLNKMNNPYEKQQQYGSGSSSGYNSMGQANQLGGTGMGTPYNVYMTQAPAVLPHIMFQDGNTGQRQGGQPKGGKQQYAQQQYWSGN